MKIAIITVLVLLILGIGAFFVFDNEDTDETPSPTPTASAAVSPTATSSPTGTPFTSANVRVTTPLPNQIISSPLTITGEARGIWFFEASFPIRLLDGNGNVIATAVAQAQSNWMTNNFVPFRATMTFTKPSLNTGTLVFEKDNPSGLPENDAQVSFPIRFR